jgi:hypothetical protein
MAAAAPSTAGSPRILHAEASGNIFLPCLYLYIYIYIYACMYRTRVGKGKYADWPLNLPPSEFINTYAYIHTYTHICTHTLSHTHTSMTCTYTHTHSRILNASWHAGKHNSSRSKMRRLVALHTTVAAPHPHSRPAQQCMQEPRLGRQWTMVL